MRYTSPDNVHAFRLNTGRYPSSCPAAVGWYDELIAKMSTECSQLPESQISCPPNCPRTSAYGSPARCAAAARAASSASAPWLSAVRSWVLSPMHVRDLDRSYRSG